MRNRAMSRFVEMKGDANSHNFLMRAPKVEARTNEESLREKVAMNNAMSVMARTSEIEKRVKKEGTLRSVKKIKKVRMNEKINDMSHNVKVELRHVESI